MRCSIARHLTTTPYCESCRWFGHMFNHCSPESWIFSDICVLPHHIAPDGNQVCGNPNMECCLGSTPEQLRSSIISHIPPSRLPDFRGAGEPFEHASVGFNMAPLAPMSYANFPTDTPLRRRKQTRQSGSCHIFPPWAGLLRAPSENIL